MNIGRIRAGSRPASVDVQGRRGDIPGRCVLADRLVTRVRSWMGSPARSRSQPASASISSSVRPPGTITIGIGKVDGGLAGDGRNERPRPLLAGAGGEHQEGDVLVGLDQLDDLLGLVPIRITFSGSTPAALRTLAAAASSRSSAPRRSLRRASPRRRRPIRNCPAADRRQHQEARAGPGGAAGRRNRPARSHSGVSSTTTMNFGRWPVSNDRRLLLIQGWISAAEAWWREAWRPARDGGRGRSAATEITFVARP